MKDKAKLIEKAKAHAQERYSRGYDTFVECYGDQEWEDFVEGLNSWTEVKSVMLVCAQIRLDRQADADQYKEW